MNLRFIQPPKERNQFEKADDRKNYLERYLSAISPSLANRVDEVLDGKVKDFITDPKIVDRIENAWMNHKRDIFDPSYFCLVHLTDYFPTAGMIRPTGEVSMLPRYTTHFCLNGGVTSHELGNWEESNLAIIVPFSGLEKTADSFLPQDVIFVGGIKLPKDSLIISRKGIEVPKDLEVSNEAYDLKNGDELRRVVAERIFDKGYLPARIGATRWMSEPYRTLTSTDNKVCHQLGTFMGFGYFPDEVTRLEAIGRLLGAKGGEFHDDANWTKLLESSIFEKFSEVYDYKNKKPKSKLPEEEFEKKFPQGLFGNFDFSEPEEQKYLKEEIEKYRLRMKAIVAE